MKTLMENELIRLIYTEVQHLPFILEAERDQENAKYVGQWPYEKHEVALKDADILHLLITKHDGAIIGYAIIRGLQNQNESIELMRIVITEKGSGYGNSALSLIKKWCFEVKKAHRLWLDVRESNLRAQHVYASQGFVSEGILRECVKVGDAYHSLVVMAILSQGYTA